MRAVSLVVGILPVLLLCVGELSGFPLGKRLYTSLPSVSDDHFSETSADGTYRYAYTGEDRFTAERRKRDGTVEGETVYVRPDGVPVRVHYFADSHGYRPKTEVLYAERLRSAPAVAVVPQNDVDLRINNNHLGIGSDGGDRAVAVPSVTAIVGPGGHADINPVAVARTNGNKAFRSGGGGDVAIANPQVHAIVGSGGSVRVNPHASALTDGTDGGVVSLRAALRPVVTTVREVAPVAQVVREIHRPVSQVVKEVHPVTVVREVQPVIEKHVVRPVVTESRGGYVYSPPRAIPVPLSVLSAPVPVPVPALTAVRAQEVVIVPPNPSYSYSYGYSAPDEKHPAYGKNEAYVNVKVNQH